MNIEPGDVIKIGPHLLACGDVTKGHVEKLLTAFNVTPDLVYTDPPWNAGIMKTFMRWASLPDEAMTIEHVWSALGGALALCGCPMMIEMGVKQSQEFQKILESRGMKVDGIVPITYASKRPAVVLGCNKADLACVAGYNDAQTPRLAIQRHTLSGDIVLDPFIGLGTTCIAAVKLKRTVCGIELSPNRLAVSVEAIQKLSGETPRIILKI